MTINHEDTKATKIIELKATATNRLRVLREFVAKSADALPSRPNLDFDPLGMRVHVEVLTSQETDERESALVGQIDRQTRGRRYGSDHGDACKERLLHNLVGGSSADEQQVIRQRQAVLHEHAADDFVYRVVPANILGHRLEPAIPREEPGRMKATGFIEYFLSRAQPIGNAEERRSGNCPRTSN